MYIYVYMYLDLVKVELFNDLKKKNLENRSYL